MARETKTIMLTGVGGQGIVLVSTILINGLLKADYDVKSSEVHGMAQRGGSVVTQVRYGDKVYSPLVGAGAVDMLFAMEKMEAARYAHMLKKNGILLMNETEIPSVPVMIGKIPYPKDINERLSALPISFHSIPATEKARELGNTRVANIIMLGAMLKLSGLAKELYWKKIVAATVKPHFRELNLKALETGMNLV